MTDTIQAFRQSAADYGLDLPGDIIPDGTLHRFTAAEDKAKSNNSWYVLYPDTPAAGSFGCWKRQINQTWCSREIKELSEAEKAAYKAKMEAMRRQREEEINRVQSECRTWCADAWAKAKNATNDNPYLKMKGVNAYGLKSFKYSLLIPVHDLAGTIHGLQFIQPDGCKRFKTGTNKTGHFFKIGTSKNNTIIICEGYATGASIHQACNHAIVVAFDCGNLLPTATAIRSKFPDMKIIVAADNDQNTDGNPGLEMATAAAEAVGAILAVPDFSMEAA